MLNGTESEDDSNANKSIDTLKNIQNSTNSSNGAHNETEVLGENSGSVSSPKSSPRVSYKRVVQYNSVDPLEHLVKQDSVRFI